MYKPISIYAVLLRIPYYNLSEKSLTDQLYCELAVDPPPPFVNFLPLSFLIYSWVPALYKDGINLE